MYFSAGSFSFYAAGSLFWGPLSDKYGRKRILLIGLVIYTAVSALCAFSGNVYQLIGFRIIQAIASGAATAVAQAIVKDCYSGPKRVSVLALVSSMTMISPIVAPVVGALILKFTSWRGIFLVLAGMGLLVTCAVIFMEETIGERSTGSIRQSIGRLGIVAKNPGFMALLITFSLMGIPMMSFITSSSYIYVNQFGLSEQVYSYYFAVNAFFMVIGPLLYMKLAGLFRPIALITASYVIACISGLVICIIGIHGPWVFTLSLIPATLAGSITRPPSANLMLEQQKGDTGAVVSLMSFTFTIFGCLGMVMISLDWANLVWVMGLMYTVFAFASLVFWRRISKKEFVRKVLV
ncbi:MAG: MFS transporter [Desulfosporosinus sp.]|nr:MFS transporter [Desulfosporosinus sp.]